MECTFESSHWKRVNFACTACFRACVNNLQVHVQWLQHMHANRMVHFTGGLFYMSGLSISVSVYVAPCTYRGATSVRLGMSARPDRPAARRAARPHSRTSAFFSAASPVDSVMSAATLVLAFQMIIVSSSVARSFWIPPPHSDSERCIAAGPGLNC